MGRPQAPCGTESAYKRHVSNGEQACEACRRANAEAGRRRRADKAAKDRASRGESAPAREVPMLQDVEVALASEDADDLKLIRETLRGALTQAEPERVAPIARALLEVILRTRPAQSEQPKAQEAVVDEFERARQARAARKAGA